MEELRQLFEKLNAEWASFKSENDRRLKEIEKTGRADPLTEEKINKHSAAVGEIQKQLSELQAKMNRPGVIAHAEEDERNAEVKTHSKLYNGYLRKGAVPSELADLQVKLLQVQVDTDGGMAVPEVLDRAILQMEIDAMPMEGLVDVVSMGGENYTQLVDVRGTTGGWVDETDTRSETTTPSLAAFSPAYGEVYAYPFATQKMLEDAFFDVEGWLARSVAERFAQYIDAAIISGTGVKQPKGLLSYTLAATADSSRTYGTVEKLGSGTSGDFDGDDLIDLQHKLKPAYRQNAVWLMATATLAKCRKFKDTTNQYIWQPGLSAGAPSVLLGRPVVEDENMPAVGAGTNAVIFGDLKRAYKFINVRGVLVLRDPFDVKGKVGFYTTKRVGGGVVDTSAYKVLTLT